MPSEEKSRFVVLYGSQKGQAQSIAEGIAEEANGHGLVADLSCLNENDKYNLEKENSPVVFIVSTTGDGEPPDNALQFVKRIKRKTLTSDHFKHLCYTLLALGDTNYANFCNCGKTIERRLQELGAKQFYATGYADDGIGLELVVDPWLEGLWNAIKGVLPKMASDRNTHLKANTGETGDLFSPDVHLNLLTISECQDSESVGTSVNKDSKLTSAASSSASAVSDVRPASPAGVPWSAFQCDAAASNTTEPHSVDAGVSSQELASSLTHSMPPLSASALNVPLMPPPYLEVSLQEVDSGDEMTGPINKEKLPEVNVSKAVQMTTDDAVKTSFLLELDISPYPEMNYQPGDSFDVYCPNRAAEVDVLLHRLNLNNQKHHGVNISLRQDTKKKGAQVPSYIPEKVSLHFLFTWCLEIRSVPKKAFLRALVEHTEDGVQKRRLQELCSKQGAADYNLYVRDAGLSLLELLSAFPSCSPPLSLLIEHLPKLQPRPYSAARHPGKLHFAFNVVEFPASPQRPVKRRGLCTGWLLDLIHSGPFVTGKAESSISLPLPKIQVSLRSSCSFRPPSDSSVPYIMVGPGTGVAPFIGFLQHREETRKTYPDAVYGETWLFYGCRHKDRDYLFREDLESFVSSGALTHLRVCFSRDDVVNDGSSASTGPPRYVQHNLLLNSRHVTDLLLKQNGFIYVCGDAKNMAKDVNEALLEMIREELQVDQLDAMKKLAALREEKRYLQDIWA